MFPSRMLLIVKKGKKKKETLNKIDIKDSFIIFKVQERAM